MFDAVRHGSPLFAAWGVMAAVFSLSCADAGPSEPSSAEESSSAKPSASASPSAPAQGGRPTTSERMSDHVVAAEMLRRALVRGDIEAFRAAAADLSGDDRDDEVWDAGLDAMRAAARRARDAEDPSRAAETLAQIGEACANCHTMLGEATLPVPKEPAGGSSARTRMRRHEWAADLLWTGLAGPSAEAWQSGAEALAGSELVAAGVAGENAPREVLDLAKRAQAAAADARAARPSERRLAFEQVMSTCAPCHEALGVAPP